MGYRVFAQAPHGRLDLSALLQNARRFFEARVEILEERGLVLAPSDPDAPLSERAPSAPWVRLRLESARRGIGAVFRVTCREATADDWRSAREAEIRGRATGMGALAARCHAVWEIDAEEPRSEAAQLNLCALLASVALGPVLPPDASTLFGIRGAMERLDALTGPSLMR